MVGDPILILTSGSTCSSGPYNMVDPAVTKLPAQLAQQFAFFHAHHRKFYVGMEQMEVAAPKKIHDPPPTPTSYPNPNPNPNHDLDPDPNPEP